MKFAYFRVVLALPLMAACAPLPQGPGGRTPAVTPPAAGGVMPRPAGDTCGQSRYAHLVGQVSPKISVPAGTEYRQYRTGDPVTLDHSPQRINFEFDRSARLVAVSCG